MHELCSWTRRVAALGQLEFYLFGSVRRESAFPSDLDVLVIYRDVHQLEALENLLRRAVPAVDLLAMTPEENDFYDFIGITSATRVTAHHLGELLQFLTIDM